MKEHDQFITTYKNIEILIKQHYEIPDNISPIKYYEDVICKDNQINSKLRLCRNIRNYIQHEEDYNSFITISLEMQKFLDKLYSYLLNESDTVEKNKISLSKSLRVVSPSIKLIEAVSKMKAIAGKKKSNTLVVMENNKPIGIFDSDCINNAILDGAKIRQCNILNYMKKITSKNKQKIQYVNKHTLYNDMIPLLNDGYIIFVMDDDNKICGIL